MEDLLKKQKVIITVGTGGVGKTTVSASMGVKAAEMGKKVLILTIDPAKRLKSALGLDSLDETKKIEGSWSGELYASMVDFKNVFDEFVKSMSKSPEMAERVLSNRLYKQLSTSLGGSQDYTSLEKLHSAVTNGNYDLVILDTPPSQHAKDFLTAPRKIYALFEGGIFKWFMPDSGDQTGFIEKLFSKGTKTVMNQLENLTGAAFISELTDFFASISELRESVQKHSGEIHQLLSSSDTAFVLVTGFDVTKLEEAKGVLNELKRGGYSLGGIVINRVFPDIDFSGLTEETKSNLSNELMELYSNLETYFQRNRAAVLDFRQNVPDSIKVDEVADIPIEITSVESLRELSEQL